MEIKYLGHAGFQINSGNDILLIDPWLTKNGEFDYSWFQYPCNHHIWDEVIRDIEKSTNSFLYITHEHKDHLDLDFLNQIKDSKVNLIFPKYRSDILRNTFSKFINLKKFEINEVEEYKFNNFQIRIFTDDTELTRDSAIAVQSNDLVFLNINDCKVHDRINEIKSFYKKIDVFSAQFSGATWHPVCYDIDLQSKNQISQKKKLSKFSQVAETIKLLNPKSYIPSAGPPCFIDPDLYYVNFLKESTFPRAEEFINYLSTLTNFPKIKIPYMMPGDVFDSNLKKINFKHKIRTQELEFDNYMANYKEEYKSFFENRKNQVIKSPEEIQSKLKLELSKKVKNMNFSVNNPNPLFMSFKEYPNRIVKVDFAKRKVLLVEKIDVNDYYHVSSPISSYYSILYTESTWADFTLSFRSNILREPDVYSTVIQGFIVNEVEDVGWFCSKLMEIEGSNERITLEIDGRRFTIDRYCPHLGADLKDAEIRDGRYLICPRHRWEFDLECDGNCDKSHNSSIHSLELDEG